MTPPALIASLLRALLARAEALVHDAMHEAGCGDLWPAVRALGDARVRAE